MKPLVSVIVPAFNAAPTIRRTLESVLAQTYQEFEVIVVDDGSSDSTGVIVEEFVASDPRFQLIRQNNLGVGASRNTGIRKALGAYIAPLDSDDFWFAGKLEKQVALMEQSRDEPGLVYCWSTFVDKDDGFVSDYRPTVEGDLHRDLVLGNVIGNASVPLFRAAALKKVGLYLTREEQGGGQGCEDWDLHLRVAEQFPIRVVPERLTAYRQTSSSMSVNGKAMAASFEVMLRRARERGSDLPCSIFRISAGNFYLYLIQTSDQCGYYWQCLSYFKKAAFANPVLLLSADVYRMFIRTLLRVMRLGAKPCARESLLSAARYKVGPTSVALKDGD